MLDDKTRMILSTLDDIIYSIELINKRFKDVKGIRDILSHHYFDLKKKNTHSIKT